MHTNHLAFIGMGSGNMKMRSSGNVIPKASKMRQRWENKNGTSSARQRNETQRETDWEYNARMKREQEEIDVILDKIRKSGYDSLTREEKQKLYDRKNQN